MEEENMCTICGDIMHSDNIHKLRCKHTFHYCCLIDSLKSKINHNGKIKIQERTCPYCRHKILPLPYKEICGEHIPNIHKSIALFKDPLSNNVKCSGICRNGQQCNFKAKYNGYCGHHRIN